MTDYADNQVLVSTDWVMQHLDDPSVKLVEVDVDAKAYETAHIPGAIGFDWQTQLQNRGTRDIVPKAEFERLVGSVGISTGDTVVIYGDNSNWFAAYAFWVFKIYGHRDVRLMNGGRSKWLNEDDKPLTTELPDIAPVTYVAQEPDFSSRAWVTDVLGIVERRDANLVDVRSPDEFTGKVIAPPGMSESAQRAGHVPGARSVPWAKTVGADGTFCTRDELEQIYLREAKVDPSKPTVAYCRIGERSSHTWFVLKYLLGIEDVKNYDGSWTEYGSMVGVPIETGPAN
ncbi:MAG: sulfurtransferase [Planctomycetota bacterium]